MQAPFMRVKSAEWLERVVAWRTSGLSADAFVEGKDFDAKTLRWWANRLLRPPRPRREQAKPTAALQASPSRERVTFARVAARSEDAARPAAPSSAIAVLVGRHRIAIAHGFDAKLLREVVHALAEVTP